MMWNFLHTKLNRSISGNFLICQNYAQMNGNSQFSVIVILAHHCKHASAWLKPMGMKTVDSFDRADLQCEVDMSSDTRNWFTGYLIKWRYWLIEQRKNRWNIYLVLDLLLTRKFRQWMTCDPYKNPIIDYSAILRGNSVTIPPTVASHPW